MISSIAAVMFLCLLEGLLSLDNALVLAVMVKHLPNEQRKKALTYGIYGAFAFRIIALFFLTAIMGNKWIQIIGGLYLLFLSAKYFMTKGSSKEEGDIAPVMIRAFWMTVVAVEVMDIVFSIDSILTAVSVSNVYWVVLTGGILGIIMMRFAASLFVHLLRVFPKLEDVAYFIISFVGLKLIIEKVL